MKKQVIFAFILGVVLTSTVVYAAVFMATDISYDNTNSTLNANNVQDAIDELFEIADKDNYDKYTYTTEGLSAYYNRVTIENGGYYVDPDNTVYVNISLKMLDNYHGNDTWGLLSGFPNGDRRYYVSDVNYSRSFHIAGGLLTFQDRTSTALNKNEVVSFKFKYKKA